MNGVGWVWVHLEELVSALRKGPHLVTGRVHDPIATGLSELAGKWRESPADGALVLGNPTRAHP